MRKLGTEGLSTSQTANVILVIAFEVDLPAIFETADEVGLLEKFLGNLSSAVAPTNIFGHNPNAPAGYADGGAGGAGGGEASHLIDEITDAPQLFEYDDIAHSGHMLVKVADLVEPPKGKKKKKADEWQLEYFILLQTKHIVHFQPNTGFVDPFKKTISGKAIDLMQAQVAQVDDELEVVDIPAALREGFVDDQLADGFEIRTARQVYQLRPKESSAEAWVEHITEVMFQSNEEVDEEEARDYNDHLVGYNDVVASNDPESA